MRRNLLWAALPCLLATAAHAEPPFAFDTTPGQLPKTVVPSAYRIDIATDLRRLRMSGKEQVDVDVQTAVDTMVLNQVGLTVSRATLEDGSAAAIRSDDAAETVTLRFAHPVAAGRHTLSIAYSGAIPQTPNGLYYDDYRDAAGKPRRMLVTQFEVGAARLMFPGWDEPAFKATFALSATLPSDDVAISNMPVASTTDAGPGMKHVAFRTTPRMSTYLLAFVAGDLAAVRGTAGATATAVWAPKGEQSQGDYALHAEDEILPYYGSYFGVPYPLPKLDLIAVPGNFEAGAMENWGAITFIDNGLLFDPGKSSAATRERIFLFVAHEMSHQWSGDLVTMGWWNDIWLNEGFATWMENKATDHFNPTWEIWPRQHQDREQAMAIDAKPTTHALQQTIHDTSDASAAFDRISYQKGEQVIRMIEDWIGPDTFRDGLRIYMKAHAYGNTSSADLWAALDQASHQDVAAVASGFTDQPGIPLVHVARSCNDGHGALTLTQDRFTIHDPHPAALSWRIPVSIGAPGAAVRHVLLDRSPVVVPLSGCDALAKANLGESGYYRTQYDPAGLAALKAGFATLAPVDRANLLGDQFALFEAGRGGLRDYLDLLPLLAHEQDVAVWQDTLEHLKTLDKLARGSDAQAPFHAFARRLLRPEFDRLGWTRKPGESFPDTLLRPELIAALGRFGDQAIASDARRRFAAFEHDPASLSPSLRAPVLGIVGRHADRAEWDALRQMGERATGTEERFRYFNAMAMARDPALLQANVAFAGSGVLPNGRIVEFVAKMAQESDTPDQVWKAFLPTRSAIESKLAPMSRNYFLPILAGQTSDPATAAALTKLPESSASAGAKLDAAKAVDAIETNVALRRRAQPALHAWLAGQGHA